MKLSITALIVVGALCLGFILGVQYKNKEKQRELEYDIALLGGYVGYDPTSLQGRLHMTILKFFDDNNIDWGDLHFSFGGTMGISVADSNFNDLSLINSLAFYRMDISNTQVTDLWPIALMSTLDSLFIRNTPVSDLSPLEDLQLKELTISGSAVTDITPLSHLPLEVLYMDNIDVKDLSPITNMPLSRLSFENVAVTNLKVLASLRGTGIDFTPELYTQDEIEWLTTTDLGIINQIPREYWEKFGLRLKGATSTPMDEP